jgi:hypothetical protein
VRDSLGGGERDLIPEGQERKTGWVRRDMTREMEGEAQKAGKEPGHSGKPAMLRSMRPVTSLSSDIYDHSDFKKQDGG